MNVLKKHIIATAFILISAVSFGQESQNQVSFDTIERVPIYPDCESFITNSDLKKCMTHSITDHISRRFNIATGAASNLTGRQRINIQFRINKNGKVDNIVANGDHPSIEKEATRVMKSLPKMIPGEQRGKPVGVLYSLPLIYKIKETKVQRKARKKQARRNNKEKSN